MSDMIEHKGELNIDTPLGMRDYLPAEMKIRSELIKRIKNIFERHGGQEIDTPVLERMEVLMAKSEDNTKLIFELNDQGQELALRYDLTIPFARFVSKQNIVNIKRYQIAKVWRRDKPSLTQGRYREFYQCDFDSVGTGDTMLRDAEVVSIMNEVLSSLDIGKFKIKLSHKQLLFNILELCGVKKELLKTVCSSIDKLDKSPWIAITAELLEKGLDKEVINSIGDYITIKGQPMKIVDELVGIFGRETKFKENIDVLNELSVLFSYLSKLGCIDNVEFDLSLARGLDYYTGIIFEAVLMDSSLNVGSIGGGGRYDNLIEVFHPQKKHIPAVGCSIGIERIFSIYEAKKVELNLKGTQVLVQPIGKDMINDVLEICASLWKHGIKTEFQPIEKPLMKDQIEYVINNRIPYMIIIGLKEKEKGEIVVKDTSKPKEQVSVKREDGIKMLVDIFKKT